MPPLVKIFDTSRFDKSFKSQFIDGYKTYNSTVKWCQKLDDDQRHASILSNVAQVYLDNQEYEKALQNFQASLKIYHSIGHLTSKAACLVNIGSIHFELENYDNALEPIEDALKIVKQNVDFHLQMVCLNSIGVIYSSRGDDDKALQKFEEAREVRFKMVYPEIEEQQSLKARFATDPQLIGLDEPPHESAAQRVMQVDDQIILLGT